MHKKATIVCLQPEGGALELSQSASAEVSIGISINGSVQYVYFNERQSRALVAYLATEAAQGDCIELQEDGYTPPHRLRSVTFCKRGSGLLAVVLTTKEYFGEAQQVETLLGDEQWLRLLDALAPGRRRIPCLPATPSFGL